MKAIDHLLGGAHEILDEEGFGYEILGALDQGAEALFDIGAAGHEKKWNVARSFPGAKLFKELASIQARHVVVAEDDVGWLIDHFEQSVSAISGNYDFAKRFEPFG